MFPECSETVANGMFTFLAPKLVRISVEVRHYGAIMAHSIRILFQRRVRLEASVRRKCEKQTSDDSCLAYRSENGVCVFVIRKYY